MTRPTDPVALIQTMILLGQAGRAFAVAAVLRADGSTPVPAGAKAVIESDGTIYGTVGGGVVEAEALRQARRALRSGQPIMFDFDLSGPGVGEPHPICGGSMTVLVDPGLANHPSGFRQAAAAMTQRKGGVWLTLLRPGRKLATTSRFLTEPQAARHKGFPGADFITGCLKRGSPSLLPSADKKIQAFVEPLFPNPVLLIIGGGHVGQALAAQASLVGFEIVVIEDRPEFARTRLFPKDVKICCGQIPDEITSFPVDRSTFIVLVTRGHQQDSAALRACIRRPAAYIGMIGSRRKIPLLRRQFLQNDWASPEEFDRIHAPIGIDIGAITPAEIAVSIVAQLISVRREGHTTRLR